MADYDRLRARLQKRGFDVDCVADGLGMPIDEQIKPLVLVLNSIGYRTEASCGGHPLAERRQRILENARRHGGAVAEETDRHVVVEYHRTSPSGKPFTYRDTFDEAPWVDMILSKGKERALGGVVEDYNALGHVQWSLRPEYFDTKQREHVHRLQTLPSYSLSEMQADAGWLAEHIYDNRSRLGRIARFRTGLGRLSSKENRTSSAQEQVASGSD